MKTNIILAYGGRDFDNRDCVYDTLDRIRHDYELDELRYDPVSNSFKRERLVVITGGARGADTIALNWALERELDAIRMPARWVAEGRSAGPLRNRRMMEFALELRGDQGAMVCVGFPGDIGTRDMAGVCAKAYATHGGMHGALWLETVK